MSLRLWDAKRINHLLLGAWFEEDIYDRLCARLTWLTWLLRRCVPALMQARKLVFVHVPRVADTSISRALYGTHCVHHHSIRFYRAVAPQTCERSFATLRDPFDRFVSAFFFVRAGGTPECRMARVFVEQTGHIRTVDDYLDFLSGRAALDLDFVMRPQAWFICDLKTGVPLVDDIFVLGEDDAALAQYLSAHGVFELPWLNRSARKPLRLTIHQQARIRELYADDFALIDSVRRTRGCDPRVAAIAAE